MTGSAKLAIHEHSHHIQTLYYLDKVRPAKKIPTPKKKNVLFIPIDMCNSIALKTVQILANTENCMLLFYSLHLYYRIMG